MPLVYTVDIKAQAVLAKLEHLRRAGLPDLAVRAAYAGAMGIRNKALDNISGRALKVRTASLKNHVAAQMPVVEAGGVTWGLPSGEKESKIGAFQEVGGTVRPKNSKFLRIPLSPAKTAAGADRYSGIPLRSVGGFHVIRLKDGRLFLAREEKKGAYLEFWYRLVRSSVVPAHPWLRPAVEAGMVDAQAEIDRIAREVLYK